jgi:hypothetical protein
MTEQEAKGRQLLVPVVGGFLRRTSTSGGAVLVSGFKDLLMTRDRDLKKLARARSKKTGEAYTTALTIVRRQRLCTGLQEARSRRDLEILADYAIQHAEVSFRSDSRCRQPRKSDRLLAWSEPGHLRMPRFVLLRRSDGSPFISDLETLRHSMWPRSEWFRGVIHRIPEAVELWNDEDCATEMIIEEDGRLVLGFDHFVVHYDSIEELRKHYPEVDLETISTWQISR